MSNPTKRILVALNEPDKLVNFSDCVIKLLNNDNSKLNTHVTCELKNESLVLKSSSDGDANSSILSHPPFCPMLKIDPSELEPEILNRGVNAGVVVLLESSDHHVLLTRRASHMRTFPGVWVPPGGGIDLNDKNLLETGLRELKEETSLDNLEIIKWQKLCLWESVYPYNLNLGLSKRHHIVVYLHIKADKKHDQLKVIPDPEEVDAAAWLPPHLIDLVVNGVNSETRIENETFKMLSLDEEKKPVYSDIPARVLMTKAPKSGEDVERLSTGTTYALAHWLKIYNDKNKL